MEVAAAVESLKNSGETQQPHFFFPVVAEANTKMWIAGQPCYFWHLKIYLWPVGSSCWPDGPPGLFNFEETELNKRYIWECAIASFKPIHPAFGKWLIHQLVLLHSKWPLLKQLKWNENHVWIRHLKNLQTWIFINTELKKTWWLILTFLIWVFLTMELIISCWYKITKA